MPDVVPEHDQRLTALQTANRIRSDRANLKRDLMDGAESIHSLLWEPPDYISSMRIEDLIRAVPGYGRVRTNSVLKVCQLAPNKRVGTMTERQRREVSRFIGNAASWSEAQIL